MEAHNWNYYVIFNSSTRNAGYLFPLSIEFKVLPKSAIGLGWDDTTSFTHS